MTLEQQQISSSTTTIEEIENGLDFLLSHFEQPVIFPRTVMATELFSKEQKKYQRFKLAYSREEALTHFKKYHLVDCRINGFPSLKEGVTWRPELLFIDLDLGDFKSTKSLQLALSKTLKNIREKLNGVSTIIESGNGYHIIQPVYCPIELEHIREFQKYKNVLPLLSQGFLRFAKDFLSNNKADKANYPSFNSCLLRIPSSINSKCLINNIDKRFSGNFRVKVLQSWNGVRVPISREFIEDFRTYLEQKITDQENNNYNYKKKNNYSQNHYSNNNRNEWIENKVLQTSFEDHRKKIVGLILVPYLVVIKKLSKEESYKIIYEWLMKCDTIRKLDFNPKYLINNNIKTSEKKLIPPISIYKLETNYRNLYILILDQNNISNNNNNTSNPLISTSLSNQTERDMEDGV